MSWAKKYNAISFVNSLSNALCYSCYWPSLFFSIFSKLMVSVCLYKEHWVLRITTRLELSLKRIPFYTYSVGCSAVLQWLHYYMRVQHSWKYYLTFYVQIYYDLWNMEYLTKRLTHIISALDNLGAVTWSIGSCLLGIRANCVSPAAFLTIFSMWNEANIPTHSTHGMFSNWIPTLIYWIYM